ncbi:hypothetical protein DTO166G4_5870 [Paecilomyces variotii]|nr:hypothetical protein DTO166G4_5870 [Paecilomyces variotii]KAJ9237032.1 hypothetical protein DTO166G5_3717 [Paecilomyces variotii]KAJ9238795.1 hypothetical protein DTO169E5_4628 [Paecilomyces variotii]KAJ9253499.1 hypothetical protein DTO195F2_7055 [Paecilomyces variotii]KAJ9367950.1 hypothetical protein DTO282E5_7363 [Paecilomyces variotii]
MATKTANIDSVLSKEGAAPRDDFGFALECMKSLDDNHNVDLTKVANALNYTNVQSVGNRYRVFRKKYGINLNCVTGSGVVTTKAGDGDEIDSPSPAKTPRKPRARKGAKVSSEPIPATADDNSNDAGEAVAKPKTPRRRRTVKETVQDADVDTLQAAIDDAVENVKKRNNTKIVKKESEDETAADSE